jgi:uncharacterized membrane protein YkvA (DUF1232 family)
MSDSTVLLVLLAVVVLALFVLALVLLVRFWRLRRQLETLPGGARWAFWGAVVYTLFPIDVLPDPIVVDDIGVMLAASAYLHRLIRERDLLRRRRAVRPPAADPPPRREAGRPRP